MSALTVFAFAGSLRKESWNRKLLAIAVKDLEALGCTVDVYDLVAAKIQPYDEDQLQAQIPDSVLDFKARVAKASATLVVTPEYNYSIPGVLKNVLDWSSRPPPTNPWKGKLCAMMGATPGPGGTIQCQLQLRHVLSGLGAWVLPGAGFQLSAVDKAFDASGALMDPAKKNLGSYLGRFVEELKAW